MMTKPMKKTKMKLMNQFSKELKISVIVFVKLSTEEKLFSLVLRKLMMIRKIAIMMKTIMMKTKMTIMMKTIIMTIIMIIMTASSRITRISIVA